jgi:hypothetical protein
MPASLDILEFDVLQMKGKAVLDKKNRIDKRVSDNVADQVYIKSQEQKMKKSRFKDNIENARFRDKSKLIKEG